MTWVSVRERIVALKNAGFADRFRDEGTRQCRKTIYNVMKRYKGYGCNI